MKKIIYLSLFLGCLAATLTLGLTFVNGITAPIIARAQDELFYANLDYMFPSATRYIFLDTDRDYTSQIVQMLNANDVVGYVYVIEFMGTNGNVRYMLSVDISGEITNFMVLENPETMGFGDDSILKNWAAQQFINQHVDTDIDIIAGATTTTLPIVRAIAGAAEDFATR